MNSKFITSIIILLLLSSVAIADSDVDSCGTLSVDGSTYTLNQSVTSTETCFTIGANNITLTSNSSLNEINFSTTTAGCGVYNNNYQNVTVKNLNITTISVSSSSYNIYYTGTNAIFGNITNNTVNSKGGYGIYLDTSSNNILNNNIATTTEGVVIYLTTSSNNNTLTNNTITATGTDGIGILISSLSNNNNISDGSIISDIGRSYYFGSLSYNNIFINTNFTTRKIYIGASNNLWFNYSNQIGTPYVSNNVSAAKTIDRTLYNWTQSNITFSESITSGTATSYYSVSSITPGIGFLIYVDNILTNSLTSDASGQLPLFSIEHNITQKTITVLAVIVEDSVEDPSLSTALVVSKAQTCSGIASYITVVVPLFGLALMIFSLSIVIIQIKGSQSQSTPINPLLISTAIIVSIVGFGMLLIGNYLIYSILTVTSC